MMKFIGKIGIAVLFVVTGSTVAMADVACVQSELKSAGYKPGPVDGALGKKTYNAAAEMGKDYQLETAKLSSDNSDEWCKTLKAANEAALVDTEAELREKVIGKKLTLDGNWVIIKADGTFEGNFGKKALAGTWNWQDIYWCRTLTTHSKNTDCQVYRVTPAGLYVTRQKGKGKSFLYTIEN
ncbi:peptidoglycan-binding domain-containing protein [Roseibium sp. HPY-6]|uniref:peptidoglycan-binding domain-containing protein n=1 Tax=Roseibium sp. HPY-6 TaxID=3229852 RepID=UPI00339067FC